MTSPRVRPDIDATREKLAALGFTRAALAPEGLPSEAVRAEMPAHVFLDRLPEAERSGREERRIRTMLKTAKIPSGATLESAPSSRHWSEELPAEAPSVRAPLATASDFAFRPAIERSRIETLATGARIRDAEVGRMQGPPGVGKSHLLCGPGIRAIQLGFAARHFRFDELLTALRADAHLPPARLRGRKDMSSTRLPVDEMGDDPMDREEAGVRRGVLPLEGRLARLTLPPRQRPLRPRRARHRARTDGAPVARASPPTRASATGPDRSPATRCRPPPSSTACCTAPMSSTSRAAAIGCATSRTPSRPDHPIPNGPRPRGRALRPLTVSAPQGAAPSRDTS